METKIVRITASMARTMLESNTINRPLRRSVVEGYLSAYKRGEHRLTHQGIAFADTGELLDGQHRLTAIAEMPASFAAQIMVTTGLPKASFDAIDQGLKRSHGDVLRIPFGLAAVARFMAAIVETSRSSITSQLLVPYVSGVESAYDRLTGFCPKHTKVWSSAAVRTAAILRMMNGGDGDYICLNYFALNHAEFDSMSPITQSLYRQHVNGKAGAHGYDLFYRCFKAFDYRSQQMEKLQVNNTSDVLGVARAIIQTRVLGQKNAASTGPAANKLNGAKSSKSAAVPA